MPAVTIRIVTACWPRRRLFHEVNRATKEDFRAIIHVVGIYCGVPYALEYFRVASCPSSGNLGQIAA